MMFIQFNEEEKKLHFVDYNIDIFYKRRKFESIHESTTMIINLATEKIDGFEEMYIELLKSIQNTFSKIKFEKLDAEKTKLLYSRFEISILKFVKNSGIISFIDEFVEKNYIESPDDVITDSKFEDIQFLPQHCKIILKASFLDKIVLPFFIKTFEYNSNYKFIIPTITSIFTKFIKVYEAGKYDIILKLHNLIRIRVNSTLYSNKVIWSYLNNIAIDETIVANNIRQMLISDNIPKLDIDKKVISFLCTIINNQLEFQFTKKFNLSYRAIPVNNSDIDTENIFDILDQSVNVNNEYNILLSKFDVNYTINILFDSLYPDISIDEFKYYHENIVKNSIQINFVFLLISHLTKINYSNLNFMNEISYIKCVLIAYKILIINNNLVIANIIMSEMHPIEKKRMLNSNFINTILEKPSYLKIERKKYSFISQRLLDNNFIFNKLRFLIQHTFRPINDFNEYQEYGVIYDDERNLEYDKAILAEAYLQFINLL